MKMRGRRKLIQQRGKQLVAGWRRMTQNDLRQMIRTMLDGGNYIAWQRLFKRDKDQEAPC